MADETNKIELELVLEDGSVKKAFARVKKEGDDAASGISNSFSDAFKPQSLTDLAAGLFVLKQAADALGEAFKKAMDFAKEGEQIRAIGARFEILAHQAGLIPEVIEQGIERAIDGTIQMDQALQVASASIVNLGLNAEKLPQLFEVARKAAAVFGGDVISRFQQISQGIANANLRQLRNIGLNIDADQVLKNYASTVGTTVDRLESYQKQQAILNAVLEKASVQYRNVSASLTPIAVESDKAAVSLHELGETAAVAFNNIFGELIRQRIAETTGSLDRLNIKLKEILLGTVPTASDNIKLLTQQIVELTRAQDIASARGDLGRIQSLNEEIEVLNQQLLIQQQLDNQAKTRIANEHALADAHAFRKQAALDSAKADRELIGTFQDFQIGFEQGVRQITGGALALGRAVAGIAIGGITNSLAAFGNAIVTGKDRFEEFGKGILKTLGALAIQLGQFLILTGLGFTALGFLGFSGAGAVAAGVGLTILGGVLQALGSSSSGTAAGGVAATPSDQAGFGTAVDLTQQQNLNRQAGTTINLTVQGSIFDSDETGGRLVKLLNDSFDKDGTVVRSNV